MRSSLGIASLRRRMGVVVARMHLPIGGSTECSEKWFHWAEICLRTARAPVTFYERSYTASLSETMQWHLSLDGFSRAWRTLDGESDAQMRNSCTQ